MRILLLAAFMVASVNAAAQEDIPSRSLNDGFSAIDMPFEDDPGMLPPSSFPNEANAPVSADPCVKTWDPVLQTYVVSHPGCLPAILLPGAGVGLTLNPAVTR